MVYATTKRNIAVNVGACHLSDFRVCEAFGMHLLLGRSKTGMSLWGSRIEVGRTGENRARRCALDARRRRWIVALGKIYLVPLAVFAASCPCSVWHRRLFLMIPMFQAKPHRHLMVF